ncbi:GAS2-like protein pickled eggs [Zeugodacus cucurbitae]|uniref:GAS2-like protein pickled eggs n=1 Tax=Zeugodacus cucurbitae TaxID=28588 RepID=UPI0023D90C39|nr:GAS2-like protein pickled eggs [Zeugodacus cucurbitae]XP_028895793.2 GAS2-like protein pickled eggs [Zeugodacus cucurbitae]XP_028895794.2 GAS2-like protein pickled eggs [Zeugodacus cucurbitae]XP_054086561.1 GAS2-like protein pickled eggs [Zeugodacus cucurbitae]
MAMLEARPYRPFKSSEEYLEAMKEDLAEWLSTLYPDLNINAENFMDRLDTGVALCKHANYVRQAAEDYLARRQARNKSMTRSMTSGSAGPILAMGNVHYLPAAKSGTFFSRDNVSNFITWCRKSLKIIECLLFETDDLIMRKNEKHVILCLLEVARRGAKFGMLAPMLVQMERQIDREIAADNKANGIGCGTQTDSADATGTQTGEIGINTDNVATETDMFDSDSENEDDDDNSPMLMYGPQPQIITNDLKSLDEMVRDLVEKCTCPSQFPMVRVSEGKYRIGDTKVLIFVRILRSHVMVRVGGGWDTLAHYLDKHDPCRCKAQHRSSVAARLVPRTTNQNNGGIELHKAQVIYERSPPSTRKIISNFNNQSAAGNAAVTSSPISNNNSYNLSPNFGNNNKQTSRSPTPQRKFLNHHNTSNATDGAAGDKLLTANGMNGTASLLPSPNLARRSMSPSPRRLIDMRKKQTSLDSSNGSGPKSLPICSETVGHHIQFDALNYTAGHTENGTTQAGTGNTDGNTNGTNNKFENISDNGSEISDEGYRSLGVIQSNAQKRESLHSQASVEDAESNARLDQTSSDSQLSPVDDLTISNKAADILGSDFNSTPLELNLDAGPQSLPAVLTTPTQNSTPMNLADNFERSGIFITDDEITVDVANATGLRKTGFATKIFGGEDVTDSSNSVTSKEPKDNAGKSSKIPRSPVAQRRRSLDNSNCSSASMQDLSTRTGLPVFNRKQPVYRSVRRPASEINRNSDNVSAAAVTRKSATPPVREVTNTWSGRAAAGKKRPTLNADTFTAHNGVNTPGTGNAFERNTRTRSSQILYDSNGRRVRGCTASLTTSPVKNYNTSPLAQQLLEAASSAKNDAQILEKMKVLLSRYSTNSNGPNGATRTPAGGSSNNKKPVYEDFTSAWVHSNGNLERSNSCSPPTKNLSKRSSAASSTESTQSRELASVIVSPRRDRGLSKIPAPTRQHTELY